MERKTGSSCDSAEYAFPFSRIGGLNTVLARNIINLAADLYQNVRTTTSHQNGARQSVGVSCTCRVEIAPLSDPQLTISNGDTTWFVRAGGLNSTR